jgi:putative membrane protein
MNEQNLDQMTLTTSEVPGRENKDKPEARKGDVGTQLAHQRTDLAMERNYMASERTLMGWIRTALSMISFGFTIGKLRDILGAVEVRGIFVRRSLSVQSVAYFLIILGTLSLIAAAIQHWQRVRELRSAGLARNLGISFYVALALIAVGGFALSAMMASL